MGSDGSVGPTPTIHLKGGETMPAPKTKNLRKSDKEAMKKRTASNKLRRQKTLEAHILRNKKKRGEVQ